MILTKQTSIWHEHNGDNTKRITHCCGCFNIYVDERDGSEYAVCNECGETYPKDTNQVDAAQALDALVGSTV